MFWIYKVHKLLHQHHDPSVLVVEANKCSFSLPFAVADSPLLKCDKTCRELCQFIATSLFCSCFESFHRPVTTSMQQWRSSVHGSRTTPWRRPCSAWPHTRCCSTPCPSPCSPRPDLCSRRGRRYSGWQQGSAWGRGPRSPPPPSEGHRWEEISQGKGL